MKLKMQKNMRIMTDLMGYCYHLGGTHFQVDMSLEAKSTHMSISTEVAQVSEETLAEITRVLNTPRQYDMEQNYWDLSGDEEVGDELLLVGVMVDHASVVYDGGRLTILLERLHYSSEE